LIGGLVVLGLIALIPAIARGYWNQESVISDQ
jgi:hypothetical protein